MSEYSASPAVFDQKAWILDVRLAAQAFQVVLPALAVGRIGEHEVELAGRKGVIGERRVFRPPNDVVGGFPLSLEEEVRLGDGVGLGVDLLAV